MRMRLRILCLVCLLQAAGCALLFNYTTEKQTIELPNTFGVYVEQAVEIPEEARGEQIEYSKVTLHYTVRKQDAFLASVTIYVSPDATADNQKGTSDEKLVDVFLSFDETEKSGSVDSDTLKDILNSGGKVCVVGAENLSLNPYSSVAIDVKLEISARFSPL